MAHSDGCNCQDPTSDFYGGHELYTYKGLAYILSYLTAIHGVPNLYPDIDDVSRLMQTSHSQGPWLRVWGEVPYELFQATRVYLSTKTGLKWPEFLDKVFGVLR